jgi:hypothetical protein
MIRQIAEMLLSPNHSTSAALGCSWIIRLLAKMWLVLN